MNIRIFVERLKYALKNETDGFMATASEPQQSGLPLYIVFNCYGTDRRMLVPRKHRKMIVEVAKEIKADTRCKRFIWDELIPIEVSGVRHCDFLTNALPYISGEYTRPPCSDDVIIFHLFNLLYSVYT